MNAIEAPNYFLLDEVYRGNQPFFYDKAEYPWVKTLEDNWHIIRDEFEIYFSGKEEAPDKNYNPPYSKPGAWKNIYFYNFMWKKHRNCKKFPKTYQLLKSIPHLTFAGIGQMEPEAEILPHVGETNTTIRGHLGLKVPGKLPECGFEVGDERRSWEEGKVFLFCDAHLHRAWNHTGERRYVLIFDVIKPEYAGIQSEICAKVLGVLTIKYFQVKLPWLKNIPGVLTRFFHAVLSGMWYIYLPIQRNIAFY